MGCGCMLAEKDWKGYKNVNSMVQRWVTYLRTNCTTCCLTWIIIWEPVLWRCQGRWKIKQFHYKLDEKMKTFLKPYPAYLAIFRHQMVWIRKLEVSIKVQFINTNMFVKFKLISYNRSLGSQMRMQFFIFSAFLNRKPWS